MKRKFKKSIVLPVGIFIYTTAMAAYFIPRNHEMSDIRKWLTLAVSYLLILALWWVLRKKEKMTERREEDFMNRGGGI